MNKMKVFVSLCGRCPDGFESSGRGESRWSQGIARILIEAGHTVVMAPDMEECGWGRCKKPENATLIQAYQRRLLNDTHFDLEIIPAWTKGCPESHYIHADKYIWGCIGWKTEEMVNGFFFDNDYIMRYGRGDIHQMPPEINFKDRCFLLAQPMGKEFLQGKFNNKRVAWIAKEVFNNEMTMTYSLSARKHLFATVDACKRAGAALSIFSSYEFDPKRNHKIIDFGIMEKLSELDKVTMYPALPNREYREELRKCSITVPMCFAGSTQEALIDGLVPIMYPDHSFSHHPWIKGICTEMSNGKYSRSNTPEEDALVTLTQDQIADIIYNFLTDEVLFNEYLVRLRPLAFDNLDSSVMYQLEKIVNHNITGTNLRK